MRFCPGSLAFRTSPSTPGVNHHGLVSASRSVPNPSVAWSLSATTRSAAGSNRCCVSVRSRLRQFRRVRVGTLFLRNGLRAGSDFGQGIWPLRFRERCDPSVAERPETGTRVLRRGVDRIRRKDRRYSRNLNGGQIPARADGVIDDSAISERLEQSRVPAAGGRVRGHSSHAARVARTIGMRAPPPIRRIASGLRPDVRMTSRISRAKPPPT